MWVFTKRGFYSAVAYDPKQDKEKGSPFKRLAKNKFTHVLVRARVENDLEGLRVVVPNVKVVDDGLADYRYRAVITRRQWKKFLNISTDEIDYYSHFKEVMRDNDPYQGTERHKAVMSVWSAMIQLQPYSHYDWKYYGGKGKSTGSASVTTVGGKWDSEDAAAWWAEQEKLDLQEVVDSVFDVAPAETDRLGMEQVKRLMLASNPKTFPDYLTDTELQRTTEEGFELWLRTIETRDRLGVASFSLDEDFLLNVMNDIDIERAAKAADAPEEEDAPSN